MGVAYGKVIADGNAVMLEVFVEHRIHIVETVLRVFVFVELAYDDTSDVFEQTSHLHIVEHTVHLAHSLASILHKQDDVLEHERIEVRTSEVVEDGEVTSHDDTLSPTLNVQRMRKGSWGRFF